MSVWHFASKTESMQHKGNGILTNMQTLTSHTINHMNWKWLINDIVSICTTYKDKCIGIELAFCWEAKIRFYTQSIFIIKGMKFGFVFYMCIWFNLIGWMRYSIASDLKTIFNMYITWFNQNQPNGRSQESYLKQMEIQQIVESNHVQVTKIYK